VFLCNNYYYFHFLKLFNIEEGEIWSMGWNADGQLGVGNDKDSNVPVLVESLKGEKIKKISSKLDFVLALSGPFFFFCFKICKIAN